ncbi:MULTISPECIES: LytR/AlgR family response regulator transcription factor [Flavobacteriaceae]|uniref:Response regulator transcription factor n=2 Tax=Flavobacteriaceae TaxID=49546 RepID=A0A4Y8ARJ9_9FLAO|nr:MULTISPECIES: LytTR family DNA-binding domain-containing protein [Flavobacteriaceae]TEW73820.1 response regulator transcription factor [Gramella jeungdoensis]GGK37875.1 DNA-binding response regulator [Lutibacter litoralis]
MTIFIIDKNINTIKSINKVLKDFSEFNCIGTSSNIEKATNVILKQNPDLIFLNIDAECEKPFEFVQELKVFKNSIPLFVAISSSKENAYAAIKSGFIDILINPLTELEIRKTVLKLQNNFATQFRNNICLKSYKDYQYLKTDEILFLKADNNTTDFYMGDGTVVNAYKTLKTFEDILPNNFYRIHKSYIINKNFISRIQYGKSTCTIKKNVQDVPFTKTYIKAIDSINASLLAYSYVSLK